MVREDAAAAAAVEKVRVGEAMAVVACGAAVARAMAIISAATRIL
jgi:hypothetical protein